MKFYPDLYVGESLVKKAEPTLEKIKQNKVIPNIYLLAMASNPDNMLDLIPEWEAMQKGYPKQDLQIIGIANGKKEAIELLQIIVEESIKETGSANIKSFLKTGWEGQA